MAHNQCGNAAKYKWLAIINNGNAMAENEVMKS